MLEFAWVSWLTYVKTLDHHSAQRCLLLAKLGPVAPPLLASLTQAGQSLASPGCWSLCKMAEHGCSALSWAVRFWWVSKP